MAQSEIDKEREHEELRSRLFGPRPTMVDTPEVRALIAEIFAGPEDETVEEGLARLRVARLVAGPPRR